MSSPTQDLAKCAVKAKFEDLPKEAVEKIKETLLDTVGCALGGHSTPKSKIVIDFAREQGGKPEASIIGSGRTSCSLAALINGELINALDYDAIGPLAAHVVPYAVPPNFAIAERTNASGKDLITAIALSLEIGGRVGNSLSGHRILTKEPPYYEESPRFSYTTQVFGGVIGASKLLHFDEEKMTSAMGIAGSSTPVPAGMKWEHTPGPQSMIKYNCWPGWIAHLATVAALMADKGFTGDTTILDGEWGFWKIYGSPYFNVDALLGGLGEVWHMGLMHYKAYPTCGCNHSPLDAINRLIQENKINPEEIENITVKGDPLLVLECRAMTEIKNETDTQFCNAYIFALGPYLGTKPSAQWQLPATYNDPKIKALMSKIKVEMHPRAEELATAKIKSGGLSAFWDVVVEITARGRKFTAEAAAPKGSPSNPMTSDELKEKFRNNAGYSALKPKKIEKVIETISNLENVKHVSELFKLLTV